MKVKEVNGRTIVPFLEARIEDRGARYVPCSYQWATYYAVTQATFKKIAKEAGAYLVIRKKPMVDLKKYEAYIESFDEKEEM